MSLSRALKVGLAAGLLAGAVLGLYIVFVMGPLIDQAEAYEEEPNPVPVFERRAAAFGGAMILGGLVGIAYSLTLPLGSMIFPWRGSVANALLLGVATFVVFSLLPVLNVPANPPGVETNLSAEERGLWYVGTMTAAFGGVLAAGGLYYLVGRRLKGAEARPLLLGASMLLAAGLAAIPFVLRPPLERETSLIPMALVDAFFYLTLVEWLVFWLVLAILVHLLGKPSLNQETTVSPT